MPKTQHSFAISASSRSTRTDEPSRSSRPATAPSAVATAGRGRTEAGLPVAFLPRLFDSFLLTGDINRHSETTLTQRRDILGKFVWLVRDHRKHATCDTAAVRDFLHHVTHGHKEPGGRWGNPRNTRAAGTRTVKNYHGILRAFFNWLVAEGELEKSPMERVPPPIHRDDQIHPFTDEQIMALLLAAKRLLHPKRDTALLLLMCDTGLRFRGVRANRRRPGPARRSLYRRGQGRQKAHGSLFPRNQTRAL
jgi:integrase